MDEDLRDLLKGLKEAKSLLPDTAEPKPAEDKWSATVLPPRPDQEGERKVSLGDVAKNRKDYEREPMERKQ